MSLINVISVHDHVMMCHAWIALCLIGTAVANPGAIDRDFGTDGTASADIGTPFSWGSSLILQGDGKLILGGHDSQGPGRVMRLHSDGRLDTSFGSRGWTNLGAVNSITLQPDGAIVAVGGEFEVSRLCEDGKLDPTFGVDGSASIPCPLHSLVHSVVLQSDGKLVVAGRFGTEQAGNFGIARLLPTGALDTSFGVGGLIESDFGDEADTCYASVIDAEGGVLAIGRARSLNASVVVRYTAEGVLDASFGDEGVVTLGFNVFPSAILTLTDGSFLVSGDSYSEGYVCKMDLDGAIDRAFGVDGVLTVDHPRGTRFRTALATPDGFTFVAVFNGGLRWLGLMRVAR